VDEDDDESPLGDSVDQDNSDEDESSSESDIVVDDDEEDLQEDPELRRKIEEALRVNGILPATEGDQEDEDGEDSDEEELMDDEQMMAIDQQLAAVFKARASEKRIHKGVDAQREATHYKNRVLDLVDLFMKKQPTSPLVIHFILPLVELIISTSSDEKHLADKATGILRSRIGKAKELPTLSSPSNDEDKKEAVSVLEELHVQARKASSSEILTTLNQCCIYMSKILLHSASTPGSSSISSEESIANVYRESFIDFVGRKGSRLNHNFIQDFMKRFPSVAWKLRGDLVTTITDKSCNGYRATQGVQLVQVLISQMLVGNEKLKNVEILAFMPTFCQAVQDLISNALSPASSASSISFSTVQLKDVLKVILASVRQTKRVLSLSFPASATSSSPSQAKLQEIWNPGFWDELSGKLAMSDTFKNATGLQTVCKQIKELALTPVADAGSLARGAVKRKAGDVVEGDDAEEGGDDVDMVKFKAKRKKVKKNRPQKAQPS